MRRLDEQMKQAKKLAAAVKASGITLTEVFGAGPVIAVIVPGEAGDVSRFRDRDHFAACNGTAPAGVSSGKRKVHRLSRRGNRGINHAVHMAAITQVRYAHSEGRACHGKKIAEGKTPKEVLRALKRRISDALCRRCAPAPATPTPDPRRSRAREGKRGTALTPARPTLSPDTGSSAQPLPDLSPHYALPCRTAGKAQLTSLKKDAQNPLTQRGFVMY